MATSKQVATHAKIRDEWREGEFVSVMANLTGHHFMLDDNPEVFGQFRKTSVKERSAQNGHVMTKFIEVNTGEEAWVFADGSIAE